MQTMREPFCFRYLVGLSKRVQGAIYRKEETNSVGKGEVKIYSRESRKNPQEP